MTRVLHSTHGLSFADLSVKYEKEHPGQGFALPDGVRFTYDPEATAAVKEKSPNGQGWRVYSFTTEIDELADAILEYGETEPGYHIEDATPRTKPAKADKADGGDGGTPPADKPKTTGRGRGARAAS